MKNSQSTADNYTPERGDVFEWYGRCYICIDGGGSSGTVVQIGQNYHIKDFGGGSSGTVVQIGQNYHIKDFGGGSSGTVVQIGQNYHIKDFTWVIDDISPVFISKATEQEMRSYFGENPEIPASSAGNILTDELTIEQQAEVLDKLFGAEYTEHLLVDYYGDNAFYADPDNLAFDFTTIGGIISYIRHTEYRKGYEACQGDMRKALGI